MGGILTAVRHYIDQLLPDYTMSYLIKRRLSDNELLFLAYKLHQEIFKIKKCVLRIS
jgi:hypothetical protein